jgi:hypothetical protein
MTMNLKKNKKEKIMTNHIYYLDRSNIIPSRKKAMQKGLKLIENKVLYSSFIYTI